MFDDLKG